MILTFSQSSPINKLGYYQIGNLKTYSKAEAFNLSRTINCPVEYIFNDHEFGQLDWSTEPADSIQTLYRKRAIQLREKYDYIVLLYSGGADSHNVLMTFINNGIHIDEIMHYVSQEGSKDPMSFGNSEVNLVAYPTAKELIDKHKLSTKHRVIDFSDIIVDLPSLLSDQDIVYRVRNWASPNNIARSFIVDRIPDYKQLADQGKSIGFVWGCDKPVIMGLRHNVTGEYSYGVTFKERGTGIGLDFMHDAPSCKTDEMFYWTPDMPEIVCKQGHLLVNHIKNNLTNVQDWNDDLTIQDIGHGWVDNKLKFLNKEAAHRVIYPYWNIDTFSMGKPLSYVFNERDRWLWTNPHQFKTVDMFLSAFKQLQKLPGWTGPAKGLKELVTRCYPLSKINNIREYTQYYY
jgi:hypothetical protein